MTTPPLRGFARPPRSDGDGLLPTCWNGATNVALLSTATGRATLLNTRKSDYSLISALQEDSKRLYLTGSSSIGKTFTTTVLAKVAAEYGLASDQQQDAAEYLGRVLEPDSTGRASALSTSANIVFSVSIACRCGKVQLQTENNKMLSVEPVAHVSEGVEMSEEPQSMTDRPCM
ncbi:hypothetical protein JCM8115_002413 [Rhodotorula mucilaginosa]